MAQHITHEGTPQELAPYLAQNPDRRFRLIELAPKEEEPEQAQETPLPDPKAAASIALLQSWLEEDATDDPD